MESSSSIKAVDIQSLINFDDRRFCTEIDKLCPILSAALKGASAADNTVDKFGSRSLCYGALFKARYPTKRACVVAHRNDQLLFAAGAKKKSFQWFNKMGISNSYSTALRKNKKLAENHDADAIGWRKNAEHDQDNADEYQVRIL